VKGDLEGIVRAIELSNATVANMKQNLMFAFCITALAFRSRRACFIRYWESCFLP